MLLPKMASPFARFSSWASWSARWPSARDNVTHPKLSGEQNTLHFRSSPVAILHQPALCLLWYLVCPLNLRIFMFLSFHGPLNILAGDQNDAGGVYTTHSAWSCFARLAGRGKLECPTRACIRPPYGGLGPLVAPVLWSRRWKCLFCGQEYWHYAFCLKLSCAFGSPSPKFPVERNYIISKAACTKTHKYKCCPGLPYLQQKKNHLSPFRRSCRTCCRPFEMIFSVIEK